MIKKLFYVSNLTFLLLYFVLAWNNRFVNDDFCSIANLHQYGILEGTKVMYNAYCTRWASVLFVHTVLNYFPQSYVLFMFGLFTIGAIVFSFYYLFKNILSVFFNYQPEKVWLLNITIFSGNAFFYSTFDVGTTWFWLSAAPTYIWSIIFFTLGCSIIISSKRFPLLKYFILALSFIYIGGSAETFAAVVLLLLASIVFYLILFKLDLSDRKIYLSRLVVAFLFCLSSLIILYVGHGNIVRRSLLGETTLLNGLLLNIKTTRWIGIHWIIEVLPSILLITLPALYGGKILSQKNQVPPKNAISIRKKLFMTVLFYIMLIFILNYPITYLLVGIGPARALTSVSFLTCVVFAFVFFYVGYKSGVPESVVKKIAVFSLVLCLLLNIFNMVQQFGITNKYALAYDTMMKELSAKKNDTMVITVSPLPPSGMLPPITISPDSTANYNRFVKQALGLKADIMLAK